MTIVLGPSTLMDKALPAGIDQGYVAQWKLQDGMSYQQVAETLATAVGTVNESMVAKWGWLISFTEHIMVEYAQGNATEPMQKITDDTRPKPIKAGLIGHMVEADIHGDAIAGTRHFWERARSKQILASIGAIVERAVWRFELNLLNRFFVNTEYAIGSGGYNVPFVRGSGGNIDFIPAAYEGQTFAATHNHFTGYNASTPKTFADVFEGLAATLVHHGHKPPFKALVSRTDVDAGTFNTLSGIVRFLNVTGGLIVAGGSTTSPQFYQQAANDFDHVADYQTANGIIQLIATSRVPTGYVGMAKSYGHLDARNPLIVYTYPGKGFGVTVVPQTVAYQEVPISQIDVEFEFGVGVGQDRTNGAVAYLVAGGTYANATIT